MNHEITYKKDIQGKISYYMDIYWACIQSTQPIQPKLYSKKKRKQIKSIDTDNNNSHEVLKITEKPNLLVIKEEESFNSSFFKIVTFWFKN